MLECHLLRWDDKGREALMGPVQPVKPWPTTSSQSSSNSFPVAHQILEKI